MTNTKLAVLVLGIVSLLAIPVLAHHPFSAEFDWKHPVRLTGTVTKLEWENPHARLYIDVEDETGKPQKWNFEMGSLSALYKAGWRKDTVKMGDTVTVDGWLARSKSKIYTANMKSVWLANGRELSGASAIGDGPQERIEPKASN
jgi:hypothetical protein